MASADLNFRDALVSDYPAIASLVKTPEEQFLIFPRGQWPFDVRQVHKLADERRSLTVAEVNERIVGFANFYNLVAKQYAFIGNVIIDQACRGRGFGRALVLRMMRLAKDLYQLPEVRISVFEHNGAAVGLYRSLEFIAYERESKADPRGRQVTLVHMRYRFDDGLEMNASILQGKAD